MLALTDTTKLSSLSYTLAELQHTITVHLPQSDVVSTMLSPNSTHRIMQIPVGSKWSPGAHWHEDYVEHIKILKGVANVWINGQLQVLEAGDEAAFQLFDVHDFCRATLDSGEVLFIEEWTENEDGTKVVFFRNAFSIVRDTEAFGGLLWAFLRFFYLCAYRDNFVAFCPPTTPRWIQKAVTRTVFGVIKVIGKVAGWTSWYTKYTPEALRQVADNGYNSTSQ